MKTITPSFFGLTLALLPGLAFAQTAMPTTGDAASAGAESGDIIVTAQKRAERLQDVPISLTTQTAAQLETAGVVTTQDMTKVVPGLVFANNTTIVQPALRGVTSNSTGAGVESPIAIYLDGIYQPSQTGTIFELPDVDRIEVLKGPQGTLFGRNATGGAIQIFTKDPTFTPSGKISISDGYYTGRHVNGSNEIGFNGYVSLPIVDNTAAISVSAYYRRNPGYLTNDVDGGRFGFQRSYGGRVKLLIKPAENVKIVATGYYGNQVDEAVGGPVAFGGYTVAALYPDVVLPRYPWHASKNPNRLDRPYIKTYGISLRADVSLDVGTLTSLTGYSGMKYNSYSDAAGAFSPKCQLAGACGQYGLQTPVSSISQEISFTSNKFGIFSLTSGVFFYHNFGYTQAVQVLGGIGGPSTVFEFSEKVKDTSYAAFTEVNADIGEHIHLIGGVRYSHEKAYGTGEINGNPLPVPSLTTSAWTPRASIRYSFDRNTSVYFTFSKGFKTGVLPTPVSPAQIPTNPEKLTSYEVGFKTVNRLFRLNAAYFHYDYTDMQEQVFNGPLAYPQNAGKATLDGFDVDGAMNLGHGLDLIAAFNYMPHAKFDEYQHAIFFLVPPTIGPPITRNDVDASGLRLQRAPKFTGNIGLDWQQELGNGDTIGGNANVYHSSSYNWDLVGSIKTKAYEDVGARIYYQFKDGLRASLWGKNLLNRAVILGSNPQSSGLTGVLAAPRQIGITGDFSF